MTVMMMIVKVVVTEFVLLSELLGSSVSQKLFPEGLDHCFLPPGDFSGPPSRIRIPKGRARQSSW